MSSPILDVIELYNHRRGGLQEDSSHTAERGYHVKTVGGLTDTARVLRAGNEEISQDGPRIPQRGEHYQAPDGTFDFTLRVKDISADPNGAHDLWLVKVTYVNRYTTNELRSLGAPQPPPPPGGPGGPVPGLDTEQPLPSLLPPPEGGGAMGPIADPVLWVPKASYYAVKRSVVVDKHQAAYKAGDGDDEPAFGDPVTNSARARFDPPVEVEEAYLGVTITANRKTFLASSIKRFVGAINSNAWRGQAARTVRCTDLKADVQLENGIWFYVVTVQLEFSPPGRTWNPRKVLDRGTWYWVSGKVKKFADEVSSAPLSSGLLDGAGGKLTIAPGTVPPVKYRNVYAYREVDFAELPI